MSNEDWFNQSTASPKRRSVVSKNSERDMTGKRRFPERDYLTASDQGRSSGFLNRQLSNHPVHPTGLSKLKGAPTEPIPHGRCLYSSVALNEEALVAETCHNSPHIFGLGDRK